MMGCSEFNFQTRTCTQVNKDFDFVKVLTVKDSAGSIVNLTGLTFQLIIKSYLGGTILLTLDHVGDNLTTGLYIPDPTSGIINIQIIQATAATITAAVYPYEMTQDDTDGLLTIFMQGTIEFLDRGF